jgi:hypothetical protein
MFSSGKMLSVLLLAAALSPVAAQARSADNGTAAPAQYHLALINGGLSATARQALGLEVTANSATIDNPTIIFSGADKNAFPDSFGG